MTAVETRRYGVSGPWVFVLHGGPGTPGTMAPVARRLARSFRVLEPLQRGSGAERLTVERHMRDLHTLVESNDVGDERPAFVGHSWGAMLALAYAAAHADRVGSLVLVGCGTFDARSRDRLRATREQRLDDHGLRQRIARLEQEIPDPDKRFRAFGDLILSLYSHDLAFTDQHLEGCDARAHHETWEDMLRLQEAGLYPATFAAIDAPVLMLHGAEDPHPGALIRAGLEPLLPQLEYHEWARCGHYPWLEKAVREQFGDFLCEWLLRQSTGNSPAADA